MADAKITWGDNDKRHPILESEIDVLFEQTIAVVEHTLEYSEKVNKSLYVNNVKVSDITHGDIIEIRN